MKLIDADAKEPYLLDGKYAVEPIKRGNWVIDGLDHRGGVDWMHCSACGCRMVNVPADITPFCPYCGAKMEE